MWAVTRTLVICCIYRIILSSCIGIIYFEPLYEPTSIKGGSSMLLICFGVYTSCFTFASGNFWLRSFFFCFWNQLGHNKRQCRGTSHALSCIHVWLATYQVVLKRCSSYSTFCSVAPTRAISSSVLVWHASTNSCKTPDSSKQLWFIQVDVFPSGKSPSNHQLKD